eukprot:1356675-Pyramimonas_sp.AAC.2
MGAGAGPPPGCRGARPAGGQGGRGTGGELTGDVSVKHTHTRRVCVVFVRTGMAVEMRGGACACAAREGVHERTSRGGCRGLTV